jgi:FeS assembly protein IscX
MTAAGVAALPHLGAGMLGMTLSWETTYAVALELKRLHPGVDVSSLTLQQIFDWTLALPGFKDDPALCNDEILSSIFQDWYEEILHAGE